MLQLIERDEHQRATLTRCRRCLDEQKPLVTGLVGLGLHLAHAQFIGGTRRASLLVAYINDIV